MILFLILFPAGSASPLGQVGQQEQVAACDGHDQDHSLLDAQQDRAWFGLAQEDEQEDENHKGIRKPSVELSHPFVQRGFHDSFLCDLRLEKIHP
jgi:hypothetical protein